MTIGGLSIERAPFASRSSRLLGQILDALVAASPVLLLVLLDSADVGGSPVVNMAAALFSGAYYLFADALPGGQSLGKRWLEMSVIDARSGEPCSVMQSFMRNLLLAILGPIDWLFIFGERHQRLGDKLAGTIVVDV
jgi:uncharacterized RDD family membrane protein YckC